MQIVDLNATTAKEFIRQQPVSAILFYTPLDVGIREISEQFHAVAAMFEENVRFGRCDVSQPESAALFEEAVIAATPTVIYYQFGKPRGEDVGLRQILKWLDRDAIVHSYGHMASGLNLTR